MVAVVPAVARDRCSGWGVLRGFPPDLDVRSAVNRLCLNRSRRWYLTPLYGSHRLGQCARRRAAGHSLGKNLVRSSCFVNARHLVEVRHGDFPLKIRSAPPGGLVTRKALVDRAFSALRAAVTSAVRVWARGSERVEDDMVNNKNRSLDLF
ncbi:hypothetical protein [Actinokineospora bangkokensis]|uniref:hypothetical protein n=1 Tax=Actinokineospora bangkokensis TaxID=1193682 RepID=UPI00117835B0|nr:hypothetical protein [Actinokineospora bangkokensis]